MSERRIELPGETLKRVQDAIDEMEDTTPHQDLPPEYDELVRSRNDLRDQVMYGAICTEP